MPGTNLIVPVVLWGKNAPSHCVSSVYLSRDQKTLVTGCYDGQICIWQVNPDTLQMTPRCLLVGHTAPVTCLSRASIIQVCLLYIIYANILQRRDLCFCMCCNNFITTVPISIILSPLKS